MENRVDFLNAFENINIPDYALSVMELLGAAGEQVYIVGGSLRDSLLGKPANDYDMAVSCPPEETCRILEAAGYRTIKTGLRHGTVTAISQGEPIELTTFRIDGSYSDSRHPESVSFTRSLENDLARRDFTINAMAYNPTRGLVDLFGGRADLAAGLVRAVGEPQRRFEEDALRILRAFRFSAQLGFKIEGGTLEAALACRQGLKKISKERIFAELLRTLTSPHPTTPLCQMLEGGILEVMTDGIFASVDIQRATELFAALPQMPKEEGARLGALLILLPDEGAAELLGLLKSSNKLRRSALAVRRGGERRVTGAAEASALCRELGHKAALLAVGVSASLGISDEAGVSAVRCSSTPNSVRELAISGTELYQMGFSGEELGRTLTALLDRVAALELQNRADVLLAEAEKIKNATERNKNDRK